MYSCSLEIEIDRVLGLVKKLSEKLTPILFYSKLENAMNITIPGILSCVIIGYMYPGPPLVVDVDT